jgi:hypothetical protein
MIFLILFFIEAKICLSVSFMGLTVQSYEKLRCFVAGFFFSGGRPEASKRNLNFQGATWHQF